MSWLRIFPGLDVGRSHRVITGEHHGAVERPAPLRESVILADCIPPGQVIAIPRGPRSVAKESQLGGRGKSALVVVRRRLTLPWAKHLALDIFCES
jgi:hypothetical protein